MEQAGKLLPQILTPEKHKPLSPIRQRLLTMPLGEVDKLVYEHTVLCQTSMPYRDPGEDTRIWRRRNGAIQLELQAGRALDPSQGEFIDIGLPFGPKARLILFHLNTEALRTISPVIELEDSLTAFLKRTLGLDPKGRNIRAVKDQLSRLAAADFRLGMMFGSRARTLKTTIIQGFELWSPKDEKQKVLWPTTVRFSQAYFESLMDHAIPLNEAAVSRLSNSAMALDVYTWLAYRLYCLNPQKSLIPWPSLREQFGQGYRQMRDFRRVFIRTLAQVKAVYPEARFSVDDNGIQLQKSPPPVPPRGLFKTV